MLERRHTGAAIAELERGAVEAWHALTGARRSSLDVEVLQYESARSVVRLHDHARDRDGAGRDGAGRGLSVIAKRCALEVVLRERVLYADVLSKLPLVSLQLHGVVAEGPVYTVVAESQRHAVAPPGADRAWLFMEDADDGAMPYDPQLEQHRVLAGRWLGLLHVSASRLAPPAELRDRGPAAFREDLRCLLDALEPARVSPALGRDDRDALVALRDRGLELASHWSEIETFCNGLPPTLVHGDFKEDHIRIRAGHGEPAVLLFDWNEGGWGVPALDAAKFLGYSVRPDFSAYHEAVRASWPVMDADTIRRLGFVGEACRAIASARWEAEKLRYEWTERPMSCLRLYAGWIADVMAAEPWAQRASGGSQARTAKPRAWY